MLKELMLRHRFEAVGGFTHSPMEVLDRRVRGGHLDRIMTRSPNTPLDECSDVLTWEWANGTCVHVHVLTTAADPFIAWISFNIPQGNQNARHQRQRVSLMTPPSPSDSPGRPPKPVAFSGR
ncbi:unnamed protein product [Vitrella brassicaformis CCMP3155]|uniref:Uncharacterized protein n=1 Tax=Vitrella brassicaformis (strain CCMP3155) TaxID=1169540 RepID=A0A0G4F9U6_VITBC|nr:unnamed protein product [Vitrella brassicaformis CCMP3155]|eukprot:CEM09732.1 unnamed protein product [Vitrella brassicaformis CCMP3155]